MACIRARGRVFASLVLVAVGCSGGSAKTVDAAGTNDVGHASDVAQSADGSQTDAAAPEAPADAAVVPPANVVFPGAPEMSCSGDTNDCPLPQSACADPSCDGGACPGLQWLVYYDAPDCVSGKCVYASRYLECSVGSMCVAGGCRYNATLAASP